MGLKKMKISSQLKGGIYEVSFGYHSKLDGYATLMSDIPKLGEIGKICSIEEGGQYEHII